MASSSVAISPPSQPDFRKMNKQALRDALASRGLDTNGLRPSLIQRLESSVKALAAAEALSASVSNETLTSNTETSQTETLANAPQIGTQTDLDASAEGQTQTLAIHSETLIGAAEEDTLKLQENTESQEPSTVSEAATTLDANMKASASKSNDGQVRVTPCLTVENGKSESKSSNTTHLSDLDRKRMRAERFGVGLQVSEKEKLALRAERFAGAEGRKNSIREPESEKRKQRAARFGIVDDEARKKAREERFASAPKQAQSVEVDKRKARAARFGATSEPVDSKEK